MFLIVVIASIIPNKSKSQYKEYDAQSLVKGGSYVTSSSSLFNILTNSPSLLYDKNSFNFEVESNIRVSEDLYNLYKRDNKEIPEGESKNVLSPIFKTTNNAYGQVSSSFSYKKIGFSYLGKVNGEASIKNPIYPEVYSNLSVDEGFVIGYGNKINKLIYGVSYSLLKSKDLTSTANVLKYNDGVVDVEKKYNKQIYSLSFGIISNRVKTILNFKKDFDNLDRFFIGSTYSFERMNYYLELHDIQDNNFENSVHYGLDYSYSFLKLNLGMNQNFVTYGISLVSKYFDLTLGYGKINAYSQYRKDYNNYTLGFLIKL